MVPKTREALERTYNKCRQKFVKVDRNLYEDYQRMAYDDLAAAMKEENPRWALTKAYQALFLMCNSILARRLGFYSKDHNCVTIALLYNNLIPEDTLRRINDMLEKKDKLFNELPPKDSFYEEMSRIRISRNRYLYLPKTLRKATAPAKQIIDEARRLIQILGEVE